MEANTIVTLVVPEEQRLVVVAVHLHGHAGAVPAHGGVVDVRDGVAALLEAEPRPSHHERNHALPMALSWEEEEEKKGVC